MCCDLDVEFIRWVRESQDRLARVIEECLVLVFGLPRIIWCASIEVDGALIAMNGKGFNCAGGDTWWWPTEADRESLTAFVVKLGQRGQSNCYELGHSYGWLKPQLECALVERLLAFTYTTCIILFRNMETVMTIDMATIPYSTSCRSQPQLHLTHFGVENHPSGRDNLSTPTFIHNTHQRWGTRPFNQFLIMQMLEMVRGVRHPTASMAIAVYFDWWLLWVGGLITLWLRLMVEGWNKYRERCLMLVNTGFFRQLFQHSEGNNCVGVVRNPICLVSLDARWWGLHDDALRYVVGRKLTEFLQS